MASLETYGDMLTAPWQRILFEKGVQYGADVDRLFDDGRFLFLALNRGHRVRGIRVSYIGPNILLEPVAYNNGMFPADNTAFGETVLCTEENLSDSLDKARYVAERV